MSARMPHDQNSTVAGEEGCSRARRVYIALGANEPGAWGEPLQSLRRAVRALEREGLTVWRASSIYRTRPVGHQRQAAFLNAVIEVRTSLPPAGLLRVLKRLERAAGRRPARGSGPRPLDLDIIDYGGRRVAGLARRRRQGSVVLPHPEAANRRFVVEPLAEVAPHWYHSKLRCRVDRLLAGLGKEPGEVVRCLDSLV